MSSLGIRFGGAGQTVGLTALSALAAVAITVAISASGDLRFAAYTPSGYVALETTAGLVAALAAYLAYGRFRITGAVVDLGLVVALSLLAVTDVLFFTGPAVTGGPVGPLAIWARALGALLSALAFVGAAFVPVRASAALRGRLLRVTIGYGVLAVGGLVLLIVLRPQVGLPAELPRSSLSRPLVVGPVVLLSMHLVAAFAFAAATVAVARRGHERGDGFMLALALGLPMAAGSCVHYFLFPSPYPDYVFAGDVFRLSFFVAILVGVLAQIGNYQRVGERLGMRRERERLIRDLHDGPVQELALLRLLIDALAARVQDPVVSQLDRRATAALAQWRTAIAGESAPAGDTFANDVKALVRGLVLGTGASTSVTVEGGIELSQQQRDDVVLLIREAMSNALRHGRPAHVRVDVTGMPLGIVVADDGRGFTVETEHPGEGRGLATMRHRAASLGGRLQIQSSTAGTEVRMIPGAP